MISEHSMCCSGEQGMVDEAQKALEEAEALKKVDSILLPPWEFQFVTLPFSYLINLYTVAPACTKAGGCCRGFC